MQINVVAAAVVVLTFACLPPGASAQIADATATRLAPVLSKAPWQAPATGVLPTAILDARAAMASARLAGQATDLETVQQHARDVLDAINPPLTAGSDATRGVGVKRAVSDMQEPMRLLLADPTPDVQALVPRAAAAARNVLGWCDQLVAAAQAVSSARSVQEAAPHVATMHRLAQMILIGRAVGADGRLTSATDDGGLITVQNTLGMLLGARAAARLPVTGGER